MSRFKTDHMLVDSEIDFDNLEEWPGKMEGLPRSHSMLESVPE